MFSGADGQVWPSVSFCEEIVRWRQDKAGDCPTVLRTFQNVGQDTGPNPRLSWTVGNRAFIGVDSINFCFSMGGEFELQGRARSFLASSSDLEGQPLYPNRDSERLGGSYRQSVRGRLETFVDKCGPSLRFSARQSQALRED